MGERFSRLYELPKMQYAVGSPVIIVAGVLLRDNANGKLLGQLKFKSISSKPIRELGIQVVALDESNNMIDEPRTYQYTGIQIERNQEFGENVPIFLECKSAFSISVVCKQIAFSDGTSYIYPPDANWKLLPEQKKIDSVLGELSSQYRRETTNLSRYIPVAQDDLWLCACSAINHCNERSCNKCKQDVKALVTALNVKTLKEHKAAFDQEKEREDQKYKKYFTIFAVISIVIALIAIVVPIVSWILR